jgi:hypothetical protein
LVLGFTLRGGGAWVSDDLRQRVVEAVAVARARRCGGAPFGECEFCDPLDRTSGVRRQSRAAKAGGPAGGPLTPHLDYLMEVVETQRDITMPGLATRLLAAREVSAAQASPSKLLCSAWPP